MDLIYVETTIPSYLAARPSRDESVREDQEITRQFWATAPMRYHLLISDLVSSEIGRGDPNLVRKRTELVSGLHTLPFVDQITELTASYKKELKLPASAGADAEHLAYAVAYRVDFLVTWNCRHIARSETATRIARLNQRLGLPTPKLVTPRTLLLGEKHERRST